MGYIVRMPKMGMEMQEGTVVEWTVGEGETVKEDDVIAEIESEKIAAEVEARETGILRRIYVTEGEVVEPGTPLGIIASPDEDISELQDEVGTPSDHPTHDNVSREPSAHRAEQKAVSEDVRISPRAKRRADELDVDPSLIDGTGPNGAVTESDVEAFAAASKPDAHEPSSRTLLEERPITGTRRTIARRLGSSYREAIHVTEHREVDAEALMMAVDASKTALDAPMSITDIFLRVLSATLDDHPAFNANFEDDVHRIYEEHNICFAVDTDSGLVAPVLQDVGSKTLDEIAEERRHLTERVQNARHSSDDLGGGTITLSNLGMFEIDGFTPIINPPQVAIVGVGGLRDRVIREGGLFTVRRFMPLDVSFDHRVVDGADAARFLGTLTTHLEEPWPFLPDALQPANKALPSTESEVDPEGESARQATARTILDRTGNVAFDDVVCSYEARKDYSETVTGPDPIGFVLGGLAACLSMSVRYQAEKRSIEIPSVEVSVGARPDKGSVESIAATVRVDASVEDKQLDRIVELAERGCHVAELLREDLPLDLSWTRVDGSHSG